MTAVTHLVEGDEDAQLRAVADGADQVGPLMELQRDEAWSQSWHTVKARIQRAEWRGDIETMHRLWCRAATDTLKIVTETENHCKYNKAHDRHKIAKFSKRTVQAATDQEGTPTTVWLRRLKK